jgi:hypothetical protein
MNRKSKAAASSRPSAVTRRKVVALPPRRRSARPAWVAEYRASLRPGLERETELMPWLIAESVCTETSRFLGVALPNRYARWLEAKAERCYAGRRQFYRLMRGRGNAARDRLYLFMRHWLASFLHLERPDLFRRLPISFGNGHRLPAEALAIPGRRYGAPGGNPGRRPWEAARVFRHYRWTWLEQLEAA